MFNDLTRNVDNLAVEMLLSLAEVSCSSPWPFIFFTNSLNSIQGTINKPPTPRPLCHLDQNHWVSIVALLGQLWSSIFNLIFVPLPSLFFSCILKVSYRASLPLHFYAFVWLISLSFNHVLGLTCSWSTSFLGLSFIKFLIHLVLHLEVDVVFNNPCYLF